MAGRPTLRAAVLLAGALLVAAACSSAPAPASPAGRAETGSQPAPATGAQPQPLPRLRTSYGANIGAHLPLVLAQRGGEFEREGLDVDVQRILTATSITALLVGELDLVQVSAPAVIAADLESGADLIFIAGGLDRSLFSLYVPPAVRSGQDLRGKAVGTDRPGTPVAFNTNVALGRLGLTPSDVQLLPIGTDGMVPGLQAGQIHAALVQIPNSLEAARLGFYPILDLYDVPYQGIGLVIKRSEMERLAPALVPFLRAYRRAIQRFGQDEARDKPLVAGMLGNPDDAIVQETYDFYTKQVPFNQSLRILREGLQTVLDSLKETTPAAHTATPEQFYDHRFVEELDRSR